MSTPPNDLRDWRKRLRAELIERRMALSAETLEQHRKSIDASLERGFPNLHRGVVAMCWPFKNEYDPRYVARGLRERGAKTALPVVVAPKTPLLFREWHPGVKTVPGVYDIPYPVDSPELIPDYVLLPMNGFDQGPAWKARTPSGATRMTSHSRMSRSSSSSAACPCAMAAASRSWPSPA